MTHLDHLQRINPCMCKHRMPKACRTPHSTSQAKCASRSLENNRRYNLYHIKNTKLKQSKLLYAAEIKHSPSRKRAGLPLGTSEFLNQSLKDLFAVFRQAEFGHLLMPDAVVLLWEQQVHPSC